LCGLGAYAYEYQYVNIGSIRNQGWELQGSVRTGPFTTKATYSWTKSRTIGINQRYRNGGSSVYTSLPEVTPGASFSLLTEHTWSGNVTYARNATTFSLNVNGIGMRYLYGDELQRLVDAARLPITNMRTDLPSTYRPFGDGYVLADLNASHRISRSVEGVLQVQNLGDSYQQDIGSEYATMGRQTKFGFRLRL
jgi:outer membrane receptor protein involved in Fe transport